MCIRELRPLLYCLAVHGLFVTCFVVAMECNVCTLRNWINPTFDGYIMLGCAVDNVITEESML
jgi:hypothetical protein